MKSILVVEDDKTLRDFIIDQVTNEGYTVLSSSDGIEAINKVEKYKPDLVLLDLGLPKLNGESVCTEIKKNHPNIQIIILTGKDSNSEIVNGLNLGADDYITKPFDVDVFIARINARMRNNNQSESTITISDLTLNKDTHEVIRNNKTIELTPKEFGLLEYFMTNKGRVLTRDMILNKIWVDSYEIESRLVDIYVGFLRKKIDSKSKHKLIKSVRGFGYMLKDEN